MSSASSVPKYYHVGAFKTGTDPTNRAYGYPTAATRFNPFHSNHDIPLITAPIGQSLGNSAAKSFSSALLNSHATYALKHDQGLMVLVAGGKTASLNALGAAVTSVRNPRRPSDFLTRYVLVPNMHSTSNASAGKDTTLVTVGTLVPVPVSVDNVDDAISSYDANGTAILDPSLLEYHNTSTSDTVSVALFVLPNAWKYESGTWRLDTTVTPYWADAAYNSDSQKHAMATSVGGAINPFYNRMNNSHATVVANTVGFDDSNYVPYAVRSFDSALFSVIYVEKD